MTDISSETVSYSFTPIATIRSVYSSRFGVPRQPGLVRSAYAEIVFPATEDNKLSLRGLEQFSHIWIIFAFHQQHYSAKPLVKPPRLGGNQKMGVYATRSPNRSNPIGMSAVHLESIQYDDPDILLIVRGGDFLDGTPVLDIKPYVLYADSIPEAESAWATAQEALIPVQWSTQAQSFLQQNPGVQPLATSQSSDPSNNAPQLRQIIQETLAQDPRPAHERGKDGRLGQEWNMQLGGFSINWKVEAGIAIVTKIEPES